MRAGNTPPRQKQPVNFSGNQATIGDIVRLDRFCKAMYLPATRGVMYIYQEIGIMD